MGARLFTARLAAVGLSVAGPAGARFTVEQAITAAFAVGVGSGTG